MTTDQGALGSRVANVAARAAAPLFVVVPGLLVRAGLPDGLCMLGILALPVGGVALLTVNLGRHPRLSGHLVTARTLTGPRTVDLTRLRRVGRLEILGRGRETDRLVLTDTTGTRLAVNDPVIDDAVRLAVGNAPPGSIKVSGRAKDRLIHRLGGRRPSALMAFAPLLVGVVGVPLAFLGVWLTFVIGG